jgi:hypothetical protein
MDTPVLIAIIANIFSIIGIYVKNRLDTKATRGDSKLMLNRMVGVENKLVDTGQKIDILISDFDFKNAFQNSLRIKSTQYLNLSRVQPAHRNVLNYFEQLVEEFGLRFYYCSFRKSNDIGRADLREYLYTDYEIKRAYLNKYVGETIDELRYINKQRTSFLELLQKSKASAKSELLIERLIQNGLTTSDLIKLFEHFLQDYYNIYLDTISLWNTLPLTNGDD